MNQAFQPWASSPSLLLSSQGARLPLSADASSVGPGPAPMGSPPRPHSLKGPTHPKLDNGRPVASSPAPAQPAGGACSDRDAAPRRALRASRQAPALRLLLLGAACQGAASLHSSAAPSGLRGSRSAASRACVRAGLARAAWLIAASGAFWELLHPSPPRTQPESPWPRLSTQRLDEEPHTAAVHSGRCPPRLPDRRCIANLPPLRPHQLQHKRQEPRQSPLHLHVCPYPPRCGFGASTPLRYPRCRRAFTPGPPAVHQGRRGPSSATPPAARPPRTPSAPRQGAGWRPGSRPAALGKVATLHPPYRISSTLPHVAASSSAAQRYSRRTHAPPAGRPKIQHPAPCAGAPRPWPARIPSSHPRSGSNAAIVLPRGPTPRGMGPLISTAGAQRANLSVPSAPSEQGAPGALCRRAPCPRAPHRWCSQNARGACASPPPFLFARSVNPQPPFLTLHVYLLTRAPAEPQATRWA
jgi:hypothetical protein